MQFLLNDFSKKEQKSTSKTDGQSAKKVMRQRITRRRAVKTEVSAPRRKVLRAHFSALIPLVSRTDIHYRDIISLSTRMAQKKSSNQICIHQPTKTRAHLSTETFKCLVEENIALKQHLL